MKKIIFSFSLVVFLLSLCSCTSQVKELREIPYEVVGQLEEYPDSTFFSDIRHAEYEDGKLYLLDAERRDLVWVSEDFKQMDYVARHSEIDLIMPISFTVRQDTAYICDVGAVNSLKIYTQGKLVDNFRLFRFNEKRMAVSESSLFLSLPTDSSCYLDISRIDTAKYFFRGKVVKERDADRTIRLNDKHLFYDNGVLFTVAESYPFIDKYDAKSGKHLETLDMSDISFIKANLDYTATKPLDPKSYFIQIEDAYLSESYLYLLCPSFGDYYRCNTILKIDVTGKTMKPVGYFILPGKHYKSICVSSDYLYAICNNPCAIEKIELEDE